MMPAIQNGKRTYIGPFGDRHEIMAPHLTDKQVANKVRMLFRDQLDHEMVCMLARDRIMHLTERVADLEGALKQIRDDNTAESHPCGPQQYGHFGLLAEKALTPADNAG